MWKPGGLRGSCCSIVSITLLSIWIMMMIVLVSAVEADGRRERRSDLTVMSPRFRSHARRKQDVMLGDRLKLRCAANGKPRPYSHWYRNNELLSKTNTKPRLKISEYSLTITRVEPGDEGQYACKVWNKGGQIWRNFTVIIIDLKEWHNEMQAAANRAEKRQRYLSTISTTNQHHQDPEQMEEWLDAEWKNKFGDRAKSSPTLRHGTPETGEKVGGEVNNPEEIKEHDDDDEEENDEDQWKGALDQKEAGNTIILVDYDNAVAAAAGNSNLDPSAGNTNFESSGFRELPPPPPPQQQSPIGAAATEAANRITKVEDRPQNDFAPWWDRTGMGLSGIGGLPSFMGTDRPERNGTTTNDDNNNGATNPASDPPAPPPALLLETWERAPYWQKHEQEMLQVLATPAGRSVKLSCRANGKPEPQVLWYKDNVEIGADTDRNSGYTYVIKKWALVLEDVVPSDEGVYTCKVFNKLGEISHNYTLKVVERLPHAPIIHSEWPKNISLYPGENATFRCYVLSDLHPHIEWVRHYTVNGSFYGLDDVPFVYRVVSDPTGTQAEAEAGDDEEYQDPTVLFIRNVTEDHEGWYSCIAGNNIGLASRTAYLDVMDRDAAMDISNPLYAGSTSNVSSLPGGLVTVVIVIVIGAVIVFIAMFVLWKFRYGRKGKGGNNRPSVIGDLSLGGLNYGLEREKKVVDIKYQKNYGSLCLSSLECSDEFPVPFVSVQSAPDNRCRLRTQLVARSCYDLRLEPDWRVQPDALSLDASIGEGAFGEVWRAKLTAPSPAAIRLGAKATTFQYSQTVAVKTLKCSATDQELCDLIAEFEVMRFIGKHPNIINLLGYCSSPEQGKPLYVIVEYCSNGNLRDFLRARRNIDSDQHHHDHQNSGSADGSSGSNHHHHHHLGQALHQLLEGLPQNGLYYEQPNSERQRKSSKQAQQFVYTQLHLVQMALQIARGMEYLASKKCVHRDLAARNVLVSEDLCMKIADFGLARNISENEYYKKRTQGKLPVKWMAPEALFDQTYTVKSDVWSFGVLLWEVMTLGGTPYPSIPHQELFTFLRDGNRMEKPRECSEHIYELMRACWNYEPLNRPTFAEVARYLDNFVMDALPDEYLDVQCQYPTMIGATADERDDQQQQRVLVVNEEEVSEEDNAGSANLNSPRRRINGDNENDDEEEEEEDENTAMLSSSYNNTMVDPRSASSASASASVSPSPLPPDHSEDGDNADQQHPRITTDCSDVVGVTRIGSGSGVGFGEHHYRASTSFSDSACSMDGASTDGPSTSSPFSSTSSSASASGVVKLRPLSSTSSDYPYYHHPRNNNANHHHHHRLSESPSPRD